MKVLLAIDGSPSSEAAIKEVGRLPWPPNSEVRIITVDAPIAPGLVKGSPSPFDQLINEQRAEAAKLLLHATTLLKLDAPQVNVTASMLEGWPKDTIVTEAERFGADMIVVGSHGYGPLRRFFLGSVSLFVAHHAPCSVLIVRQPPEIEPGANL
jgi:nucleotide-binding universal stress UspA family protein